MLRGLLMTLTLCLTGALCAPTQAAQVVFAGTLTQSESTNDIFTYGDGTLMSLNAGFNPGGPTALVTNLALSVNGISFTGLTFNPLTSDVTVANNGTNDTVRVRLPGTGSGGTNGLAGPLLVTWDGLTNAGLTLTSSGTGLSGGGTSAWQAIYNVSNAASAAPGVVTGVVRFTTANGTERYVFTGAAVPEPGSIALLSGLGLVFGAVRRRRQARATAV